MKKYQILALSVANFSINPRLPMKCNELRRYILIGIDILQTVSNNSIFFLPSAPSKQFPQPNFIRTPRVGAHIHTKI